MVIQHVPYEGPGLIATLAAGRGLAVEVCHVYRGDPLPELFGLAGLVVMGGPMGVHDTADYPHLAAERHLLASAVEHELPVLGVCLGAQLLASALGAEVTPGPAPEVGLGEVALTEAGLGDPVLGGAGPRVPVLHWHGDTFSLPAGASLLARSDAYPHQAFRAGRAAYGLQFHVELEPGLADSLAAHLPAGIELAAAGRALVQAAGELILGRFFDVALGARSHRPVP